MLCVLLYLAVEVIVGNAQYIIEESPSLDALPCPGDYESQPSTVLNTESLMYASCSSTAAYSNDIGLQIKNGFNPINLPVIIN